MKSYIVKMIQCNTKSIGVIGFLWASIFFLSAQPQDPGSDSLRLDKDVLIGKLKNGLSYYIRKNEKPENRAEILLGIKAGSLYEDEDQLGLAHILEHMVFNGTKSFPGTESIDSLSAMGIPLGKHVNAVTSFDNTYYKMSNVPTDKEDIFQKALFVIKEWVSEAILDPQEIDKERGVVKEEWRMRKGLSERVMNQLIKSFMPDSRHAKRLPIGTLESINNFPHQRLKDFYQDWYRPDLMGLVVVGDVEVKPVLNLIEKLFSDLKVPDDVPPRVEYPLEFVSKSTRCLIEDKEAPARFTRIALPLPEEKPSATISEIHERSARDLIFSVLGERLSEIILHEENAPFLSADVGQDVFISNDVRQLQLDFAYKEEKAQEAWKRLYTEVQRIRTHGITQGELNLIKKRIANQIESRYAKRNDRRNAQFASQYLRHFFTGAYFLSAEDQKNHAEKFLENLSLEDLNARLLEETLKIDLDLIYVLSVVPEGEAKDVLSIKEIKKIARRVKPSKLQAYEYKEVEGGLEPNILKIGRVISRKELFPEENLGVTELQLSNGIKVFLKPTDFKNEEIRFSAISLGGESLLRIQDLDEVQMYSDVVYQVGGLGKHTQRDLKKLLTGKKASLKGFIDSYTEELEGSTRMEDIETFFQILHLNFTEIRPDPKTLAAIKSILKSAYEGALNSPDLHFQQIIKKTLAQNHPRSRGLPTQKEIDDLNWENLLRIHQERFGNPADFAFFLVGSFEVEKLIPYLEKYIGSLDTIPQNKEKPIDHNIRPPQKNISLNIKKGADPKAAAKTRLYLEPVELPYTEKKSIAFNVFKEVFQQELIAEIREKNSDVYSISVNGGYASLPYGRYELNISFSSSIDRVDPIIEDIWKVHEKISLGNFPEEKIKGVIRKKIATRETNLKKNGFWIQHLTRAYTIGKPFGGLNQYVKIIEAISKEDIQKAAQDFISTENIKDFTLIPEEQEEEQDGEENKSEEK
ncbi:MAG: insulinase family protein [Cytophagales bacterium]|nr:insulinase family protein [Cytophagales bacterium]